MTTFSPTSHKVDEAFGYLMFLASEDFHGLFPGREEMGSFVNGFMEEVKSRMDDFEGGSELEFANWLRHGLGRRLAGIFHRSLKQGTALANEQAMNDRLETISKQMGAIVGDELHLPIDGPGCIKRLSTLGMTVCEMESPQREIFLKYFFRDHSVEKIARDLHLSQGAIQRALKHGIRSLAGLLTLLIALIVCSTGFSALAQEVGKPPTHEKPVQKAIAAMIQSTTKQADEHLLSKRLLGN